ncbi:MAG TPA: hypothetical protein PLZ57_09710 [Pseudobdellovibrionaceae bacterium]|nr:hypothetical protein [Pseudobdellovibrionaceae bacterium]
MRWIFLIWIGIATCGFSERGQASEAWEYAAFPRLVATGLASAAEDLGALELQSGSRRWTAMLPDSRRTHPSWGVEQAFISSDLRSLILVKQKVRLRGEHHGALDGWTKLGSGHVLHLQGRGGLWAIYVDDASEAERKVLAQEFRRLVRYRTSRTWLEYWAQAQAHAHAETAATHHIPTSSSARPDVRSRPSAQESGILSGVFRCSRSALAGAWNATGGAVEDAAEFVWGMIRRPSETWDRARQSVREAYDFVANIRTNIRQMVEGFEDLSGILQTELICGVIGALAAGGALAVLTAGGGAARLAALMAQYAVKIKNMLPFLRGLSADLARSSIVPDQLSSLMRRLMSRDVPEARVRTMNELSRFDAGMAMEAAACALD